MAAVSSTSSGATYSSWSKLAQGLTVEGEKEKKEKELKDKIQSTWGNKDRLASLKSTAQAGTASSSGSAPKKRIRVGAQEHRKDKWDKIVSKYLRGIESRDFDAYPYHSDAYFKKGDQAAVKKTAVEEKIISGAHGTTLSWEEFQALGASAAEAGGDFAKEVKNRDNHLLPVKEIFKNYGAIRVVKSEFEHGQLCFNIPCKANWSSTEEFQFGILEVTLNPLSGKPNHVYFKEVYPGPKAESFLVKRYGDAKGTQLLGMLNALEQKSANSLSLPNGTDGAVVLLAAV